MFLSPKAGANEKPPAGRTERLSLTDFAPIGRKTAPASPADHLGRFTGVIRHRPPRVSLSRIIKPVRACIWTRVGNKLGTVLATSAPCGHTAKTPRWRRASLGFATLSTTATCFQRDSDGRRAGLKIRTNRWTPDPRELSAPVPISSARSPTGSAEHQSFVAPVKKAPFPRRWARAPGFFGRLMDASTLVCRWPGGRRFSGSSRLRYATG